jgi:hypothetical protein
LRRADQKSFIELLRWFSATVGLQGRVAEEVGRDIVSR